VARIVIRLVKRQTGDKRRLLLSAAWPTGVFIEERRQRLGVGDSVGIQDPNPIEPLVEGVGDAVSNRAADAYVFWIANDRRPLGKCPVQGPIGRTVVYNDKSVWPSGLPFKSGDSPLDDGRLVERVNVG
jgi:hypothetical protein